MLAGIIAPKRPLVCFIAMSLGGYIAGSAGESDWLFTDQDYGDTQFVATVDTAIMGRKPYDRCLTFAEYLYPEIPNYVYIWSRTRRGEDERTTFVSGDIVELLKGSKEKEGEAIWLVGGNPWWE